MKKFIYKTKKKFNMQEKKTSNELDFMKTTLIFPTATSWRSLQNSLKREEA